MPEQPVVSQDINFDHLADLLKRRVSSGSKGRLRLALLKRDLSDVLPQLFGGPSKLKILDAGAGEGEFAIELAKAGHHVFLCDHSEIMLTRAQQRASDAGVLHNTHFYHGAIQSLPESHLGHYDLVLCHAVLEWMVEPRSVLAQIAGFIKPGGHLSLMFYNAHSTIFRSLIRGYLDKAKTGRFEGNGQGLTPINPLPPEDVKQWCQQYSLDVILETGVRVFHDYMHKDVRERRNESDVLELELKYSRMEPFRAMGRYYHLLCGAPFESKILKSKTLESDVSDSDVSSSGD